MSSAATFPPLSVSRPKWLRAGPWIQSAWFDVSFFILAPLLTLPIVAALYIPVPWLAIGGGITLAFAHYLSTGAFFLWDDNRAYQRSRWLAFYAGPVILAAVYVTLLIFDVPYIIQFVLFFWNTFHVARQNCGLLSIYRHKAGIFDKAQRDATNDAVIAVSMFLSMWNISTHKEVNALYLAISPYARPAILVATGLITAFCLARFVRTLVARIQRGTPMPASELLFLATAFGFFYPFLLIGSSELATYAMLLPHYVQYMGLVWLLHRRRFRTVDGSIGQRALSRVSGSLWMLLPLLLAIGGSFYAMSNYSKVIGMHRYFEMLYLLIALEHFYLDGLIWSFKQPHVRETIGPHLLRQPEAA
jgi:hypothetical protein